MTEPTPPSVTKRLALWTVVCLVSAAPSYVWAASEFNHLAMLLGVACFIALMTAATCTRRFERFKARPFVRRTLYIGYGTRMLLSVAVPVGMGADVWPGILSITFVESLGLEGRSFAGTLAITLVQGTILNALLTVYMSLVYLAQRIFLPAPKPAHCCPRCGYDLRGTAHSPRCPECGTAVAEPDRPQRGSAGTAPAAPRPLAGGVPCAQKGTPTGVARRGS